MIHVVHRQHCGDAELVTSPEKEDPTNEREVPGLATIL